jgi:hypothetical protein
MSDGPVERVRPWLSAAHRVTTITQPGPSDAKIPLSTPPIAWRSNQIADTLSQRTRDLSSGSALPLPEAGPRDALDILARCFRGSSPPGGLTRHDPPRTSPTTSP